MKERKHDHTEDGNTEDMITARWRLKMVTLKKNYRVRGTVYGVRSIPYSVDNAIEEANGRTAVGLVINHNHNYQEQGQVCTLLLRTLSTLALGADRLLVFMENFCSFSWITDAGRSALGNGYWQLVGR